MASLQLPDYDETKDKWKPYLVRAEAYFEANSVTDPAKKRALLVSALSSKTVEVLAGRVAPRAPNELTYKEVVQSLNEYYDPKKHEITESYKFFNRSQLPGESVSAFLVAIRRIADNCNFGTSLDRMLRDRIVCGVRSVALRKQMLAKKDLTLEEAEALALSVEAAENGAESMTSEATPLLKLRASEANTVKTSPTRHAAQHCDRCGSSKHDGNSCRWIRARCYRCGRHGHLAKMCRTTASKSRVATHAVEGRALTLEEAVTEDDDKDETHIWTLLSARKSRLEPPIRRSFSWNGVQLTMEVDTGSPVCVISKNVFDKHREQWPALKPSQVKLSCYVGPLPVMGELQLCVQYRAVSVYCRLIVLNCSGPNLCGRDLISLLHRAGVPVLQPSAQDLLHSTPEPAGAVHNIVDDYHDVFSKDLGLIKGPPATLQLKEGAVPKFCKARSIPYALRDRVTQELDRLVAIGVLSPVQHSDWATPIVPVLKKDGTVRICGDFKATLNPACTVEQYPLPVIEDMFASLNGGEYFSILDLRDAYNQVPLDEAARKLCVINTHRGLFSYNRLPFGISSAPAIFQRKMDAILSGLPGVQAYLDDVLVSEARGDGSERLKSVLQRFREHGVKLRSDKCSFRQPSVTYLGHRIDREGLHPTEKNLEAIAQAPRPQNVAELRSFLGMLTFYAKFLPNMSTLLSPLNKLLEKGTVWQWGRQQEAAFEKAKDSLMQAQVLVQFDPLKELKLECDASPYGVGAALFHTSNGMPKPIGFRSRTLTAAEKNYSQLEREALALVFGVTKFRDYLLGRQFTLVTDHQPLLSLLQSDRPTPPLAAARIQRWALYLGGYRYKLQYTPGKQLLNADALSRLPLRSTEADDVGEPPEYVLALDNFDDGVITTRELQQLSATDPAVTAVKNCILHGWPKSAKQLEETMRPFFDRKLELSVAHGLVYWGHRVVIPEKARDRLLKLLHETHQGSSGMKAVARSKFWWPRLDRDIEALSAGCTNCAQNMPMPAAAPPVNWPKTNEKWSRLHVDFAGPIAGKMILVAVDAHTKWIEAVPVKHATTTSTITCLRAMFSRFGVPRTIVSDNGTQFSSQDFATFVAKNNIMHLKTAPFHPQSNGAAERAVRTIKDGLRKMREGNLEDNLVRLLFNYRRTPQKTGKSPSELLLGFQLRSRLDACFPSTVADSPPASDDWVVPMESNVYVRNYGVGEKWTPGRVQSTAGSRMVTVQTPHSVVRRHVDQVRPRQASQSPSPGSASLSESNMSMLPKRSPGPSTTSSTVLPPEALTTASPHDHPVPTMPQAGPTQAATPSAEPVLRRSTRQRKPVQRFHF